MDNQKTPILAKSVSSGSNYTEPQETYNSVTIAAHKEAQDIMSGKKKTKTYHSSEEFLADLKA
jgi:hypothetical protein